MDTNKPDQPGTLRCPIENCGKTKPCDRGSRCWFNNQGVTPPKRKRTARPPKRTKRERRGHHSWGEAEGACRDCGRPYPRLHGRFDFALLAMPFEGMSSRGLPVGPGRVWTHGKVALIMEDDWRPRHSITLECMAVMLFGR